MKRYTRILSTLLIALMVVGLAACQPTPTPAPPTPTSLPPTATPKLLPTPTPTPAPYPMTVTDMAGREVTIPTEPQRIVSLAPSITEILFALNMGERVAGVTKFCNYPPEAAEKPQVGGLLRRQHREVVGGTAGPGPGCQHSYGPGPAGTGETGAPSAGHRRPRFSGSPGEHPADRGRSQVRRKPPRT